MNRLSSSTSPYLLQHAQNPVDWFPWCDEAFEKARAEDKLVLVSIGYSACHWCHVMEHESFEDADVASLMNDFFVCIKVDREERPDIDQVYMAAVQLLTGQGGWPLNCFALPDGRPVYGGTYFPKTRWKEVLFNLAQMYRNERDRVFDYAAQLADGVLQQEGLLTVSKSAASNSDIAGEAVVQWSRLLDHEEGGPDRAPKFPLPNNYLFLLAYSERSKNSALEQHIRLTLRKMAYGGIYDQLGGGFSRYSVDDLWKVPHFEKMLYDNAQLISLYSQAFKLFKDPLYRDTVYETIAFAERDLKGSDGNFFSALDADSEGVEGKYYVWTQEEITDALGENAALFFDMYNPSNKGYWEHGNYILLRDDDPEKIAAVHGIDVGELRTRISECKNKLMAIRSRRIRPGLDDKTLASWNGLMMVGLLDAFDAFGEQRFKELAIRTAGFITREMVRDDGGLWHSWKGRASINGYLEDYAFVIQAFIRLYQVTFERRWLDVARDLTMYAMDHFSDDNSVFWFFTSDIDPPLFARKHELQDNVIPASNSQMAINLYLLGRYYAKEGWVMKAKGMWNAVSASVEKYGSAWSNWLLLNEFFVRHEEELVICGENAIVERSRFAMGYHPFVLLAGCIRADGLPLNENRVPVTGTAVYRCVNKVCGLPVQSVDQAF